MVTYSTTKASCTLKRIGAAMSYKRFVEVLSVVQAIATIAIAMELILIAFSWSQP